MSHLDNALTHITEVALSPLTWTQASLTKALSVDLSSAKATRTRECVAIAGAMFKGESDRFDLMLGLTPQQSIFLIYENEFPVDAGAAARHLRRRQ